MPHRVLAHTADTGVEATAPTLAALVAELAAGVTELMVDPRRHTPTTAIEFDVAASSAPDLVVDALSELLSRADAIGVMPIRVDVVAHGSFAVTVNAAAVDAGAADLIGPPIKAVTYHDLAVRDDGAGWYGRVYLDV